jgi:hypothetical protein
MGFRIFNVMLQEGVLAVLACCCCRRVEQNRQPVQLPIMFLMPLFVPHRFQLQSRKVPPVIYLVSIRSSWPDRVWRPWRFLVLAGKAVKQRNEAFAATTSAV